MPQSLPGSADRPADAPADTPAAPARAAPGSRPAALPLSPRQAQCLRWAAIGKTSWETSRILGLSESTVNFHLRNACERLGVRGRRAAVAKAPQENCWMRSRRLLEHDRIQELRARSRGSPFSLPAAMASISMVSVTQTRASIQKGWPPLWPRISMSWP